MPKAIFTGSFDPFTIGHLDIVRRSLPLFDQLTICVGCNEAKTYRETVDQRMERIRQALKDEPRVTVTSWNGLTVDYCTKHSIPYIIKGIRSMKDYEYEREQAEMNRRLSGVETLFLFSDPRYSAVSSSVVRLLESHGRDVSEFLP